MIICFPDALFSLLVGEYAVILCSDAFELCVELYSCSSLNLGRVVDNNFFADLSYLCEEWKKRHKGTSDDISTRLY